MPSVLGEERLRRSGETLSRLWDPFLCLISSDTAAAAELRVSLLLKDDFLFLFDTIPFMSVLSLEINWLLVRLLSSPLPQSLLTIREH